MSVAVITVLGWFPARTVDHLEVLRHARICHRRVRLDRLRRSSRTHRCGSSGHRAGPLTAAGVQVRRGTLDDPDILREAAAASDGVIHLAFRHDIAFSGDFQGAGDSDRRAVEAIGEALAGSGRPFVIAATLPPTPGRATTERDMLDVGSASEGGPEFRMATAQRVLALASRGVRSAAVRLPPTVHGEGDPWFTAVLVRTARDK